MSRIASPVFAGVSADISKVVDVYTEVSSDVRNALTPQLSAFGSSLSDALGGVLDTVSGIGEQLLGNGIDLGSAKDRIQKALGGSRSEIMNLANDLQQSLYSELTGLEAGTNHLKSVTDLYDSIKVITLQGEKVFKGDSYKQASAIMNFVSDLTGNSTFKLFDLGAEAAVLKGVVGEISKWGVPELLDDVLSNVNEETKRTVVARASSTLKNNADLTSIQTLINHVGVETLLSQNPDFAQAMIARYKLEQGVTPDQYPAKLTQLIDVLTVLMPEWFTTYRYGTPVVNYQLLGNASADARLLLGSSVLYRPMVLAAPFYKTARPVKTMLKSQYPLIPLTV